MKLELETWPKMMKFADVGRLMDGRPQGCYVSPEGVESYPEEPNCFDKMPADHTIGMYVDSEDGIQLARKGYYITRDKELYLMVWHPDVFNRTYERIS